MTRSLAILSFILALALPRTSSATTYSWNPARRPSISIEEAHAAALKEMTPEQAKTYYLTSAELLGNREGDGKDGAWNLYFEGGATRLSFFMDLDGTKRLSSYTPPPAALAKDIKSLADVEQALAGSLHLPTDAVVVREGNTVTVSSKTRTYQVHPTIRWGEYGDDTVRTFGPDAYGLILRIREIKSGFVPRVGLSESHPYRNGYRRLFPGFDRDHELLVEAEYGQHGSEAASHLTALIGTSTFVSVLDQRPTVSFLEALKLAQAALGKEDAARYYCFDASAPDHGPKVAREGQWWLQFGATDGSQKIVHVDARGKAEVVDHMPPAFEDQKKLKSLDDAATVFPEFLRSQKLKGIVKRDGETLRVEADVRKYTVHAAKEEGGYAIETSEIIGPAARGLVVNIRETDHDEKLLERIEKQHWGQHLDWRPGPYFSSTTDICTAAKEGRMLMVEVQSGGALPYEMQRSVWDLFERKRSLADR